MVICKNSSVFAQFVVRFSKQTEHGPHALPHHDQRRQRDPHCFGCKWTHQLAWNRLWGYRHVHACQNSCLLSWTRGSFHAVCCRCVRVSGSSAVLSKGQNTGAERSVAVCSDHPDGMEEQQWELVPLWQVVELLHLTSRLSFYCKCCLIVARRHFNFYFIPYFNSAFIFQWLSLFYYKWNFLLIFMFVF